MASSFENCQSYTKMVQSVRCLSIDFGLCFFSFLRLGWYTSRLSAHLTLFRHSDRSCLDSSYRFRVCVPLSFRVFGTMHSEHGLMSNIDFSPWLQLVRIDSIIYFFWDKKSESASLESASESLAMQRWMVSYIHSNKRLICGKVDIFIFK